MPRTLNILGFIVLAMVAERAIVWNRAWQADRVAACIAETQTKLRQPHHGPVDYEDLTAADIFADVARRADIKIDVDADGLAAMGVNVRRRMSMRLGGMSAGDALELARQMTVAPQAYWQINDDGTLALLAPGGERERACVRTLNYSWEALDENRSVSLEQHRKDRQKYTSGQLFWCFEKRSGSPVWGEWRRASYVTDQFVVVTATPEGQKLVEASYLASVRPPFATVGVSDRMIRPHDYFMDQRHRQIPKGWKPPCYIGR